ncbi:MutT/nudix family protein [Oceanicaulis alexandrii HTCC2633]|uniref:NUDIX hydrolase n=1 Tax=Oceanicaulis sp. HTCC2633 TaxID=314254 RepID=UPI000066BBCF|nr:NUDIX hydrolase [Oceanicaulis sp. HTCC2633]EAP89072.1 MutT/nudix family protein [Oceanicaulis alexandrii HTCC2633] [Oceanicaulis sp. HTCC2633]
MKDLPRISVGLVVWREDEVLLIRRANPPFQGCWSIPGGKVEFGETLHQAGLREVLEETGIRAQVDTLIDVFESITEHGHYVMADFSAHWLGGEPEAGDDALEAAFFSLEDALRLVAWDDTRTALRQSAQTRIG